MGPHLNQPKPIFGSNASLPCHRPVCHRCRASVSTVAPVRMLHLDGDLNFFHRTHSLLLDGWVQLCAVNSRLHIGPCVQDPVSGCMVIRWSQLRELQTPDPEGSGALAQALQLPR